MAVVFYSIHERGAGVAQLIVLEWIEIEKSHAILVHDRSTRLAEGVALCLCSRQRQQASTGRKEKGGTACLLGHHGVVCPVPGARRRAW